MKGTNSIKYVILIIIALVVVVGASQAAMLTGGKADPSGTVSTVSSSGSSSKDYLECTFKCIGHGECKDIRPSGQVCDEKGICIPKPTCDVVFNPDKEAMKPDVYSEKESAEKQVTASFEGVFLPRGIINIKLPLSLAKEYVAKEFFVTLTADNGPCYICAGAEATTGYSIVSTNDQKKVVAEKSCIAVPLSSTGIGSKCIATFPDKIDDKITPTIMLPYDRDANNIETILNYSKGFTITLMKASSQPADEKVFEKNSDYLKADGKYYNFAVVGSKADSWSCPPPDVQENTGYEPEEKVVFNFSEGWMNAKDNVAVQIGRRIKGAANPTCDMVSYTFKPTCTLNAEREVNNEKQKNQYVTYSFKMPYRMPDEPAAVSYQVYAEGIDIRYPAGTQKTSTPGPMCSTGTEAPAWHCPEKGCYVDAEGKIGGKGKSYIVSAIDRDNGKYPVKVCKYSKVETECSTGCRQVKKDGVKTAECNLPKPDIKSVFITTCKTDAGGKCVEGSACGTYVFKDGEYVENNNCRLTFDAYDRKFVTIAVKNDVPAKVADDKLTLTADKITDIKVFLGGKELKDVLPVKIRRYDADKNSWEDESIDYSKGLSATILKPQDYIEYDAMADADGSDSIKNNPHGGAVSITIDPKTKIASDTKLEMPFTYYIFQKCCSDCSSCKALGAEVCAGTDMNKGQCGNWCTWDSILGVYSYCKSK